MPSTNQKEKWDAFDKPTPVGPGPKGLFDEHVMGRGTVNLQSMSCMHSTLIVTVIPIVQMMQKEEKPFAWDQTPSEVQTPWKMRKETDTQWVRCGLCPRGGFWQSCCSTGRWKPCMVSPIVKSHHRPNLCYSRKSRSQEDHSLLPCCVTLSKLPASLNLSLTYKMRC